MRLSASRQNKTLLQNQRVHSAPLSRSNTIHPPGACWPPAILEHPDEATHHSGPPDDSQPLGLSNTMRPSANQGTGHAHEGALEHPFLTVLLAIVFLVQLCMTLGYAFERKRKSTDQDATTGPADPENAFPSKSEDDEQLETPALAPAASTLIGSPSSSYPTAPLPQGQRQPPIRPSLTLWLAPYLTARWHKVVALAVYLTTLGVQLLEGCWIKELLARMTAELFRISLNLARSGPWFPAAIFPLAVGIGLALDLFAVFAGALIVWVQVVCIVELYCFTC